MPRTMADDFEDDGASFRVRRQRELVQLERVVVIDNRPVIEKPPVPKVLKMVLYPVGAAGMVFLATAVVAIAVTAWERITG